MPPADRAADPTSGAGGRITVEPSGITFDTQPGETVFAAATRLGLRWPTVCGGLGTCRTCFMHVLEGYESCSPIESWEAEGLEEVGAVPGPGVVRLACQTGIAGEVRVRKPGVRRLDRPAGNDIPSD